GQSYPEGWGVFIDLNQDGDFGANERVFVSDGVSTQSVSGVINIPNDAVRGLTRMRIIMLWNDIPDVGCGNMGEDFGEVEDYCVTISDRIDEPEEEPFFTDPTVYLEPSLLNAEVFPVQNPTEDAEAFRSNPGASDRINGLSDWSLSPNPSYGQLVVSYSFDTQLASLSITVTDLFGRSVYSQAIEPVLSGRASLDLHALPSGVYLVQLQSGDGAVKPVRWVKR
ncbi:MAG: GEVED domain-containing protein, partial [Bacteroidota bacterium]